MNIGEITAVTFALQAFVTLFVIMDPPGATPIFLGLVSDKSPATRRKLAWQAAAVSFIVITTFALFGRLVLSYLNISLESLQAAGGLLLLIVALELLMGGRPGSENRKSNNIALVPLGTPLLAGPGAIVATIVFFGKAEGTAEWFSVVAAIACALSVSLITLRFSGIVKKIFRPAGVVLLARVAGMLLAAIAVQMIADSVTAFVHAA